MVMYPSYKNPVPKKDFEPNPDDDDDDDVRRSSMDDSPVRHGRVTDDDLYKIDHYQPFGGKKRKRMTRRKRRF